MKKTVIMFPSYLPLLSGLPLVAEIFIKMIDNISAARCKNKKQTEEKPLLYVTNVL